MSGVVALVLLIACANIGNLMLARGIAPALRAARAAPIDALKTHGPGAAGAGPTTLSGGLIVAQLVLSLLLVAAAGLFVQTFDRLARVPLGFDPDRVLVGTVNASAIPFADRVPAFHRLVQAVRAVPGVAAAGGSLNPPIVGELAGDVVVSQPGTRPPPDGEPI